MIESKERLIHWNYFLAIEEDLYKLSRYVDFSEGNYNTYSLEIARILMASCAEIDVVLKQLSALIDPDCSASNINSYYNIITSKLIQFKNFEVTVPLNGLQLCPWSLWNSDSPPKWWTANNRVKHHRHEDLKKGNLEHCLNSVAALYIAVLHLYSEKAIDGDLLQIPKLFNVSDQFFGGTKMGRFGNSFRYKIETIK